MNSPKNGDAIFAILVVSILCLVILFIPVSIVFLGFKFLSSLPEYRWRIGASLQIYGLLCNLSVLLLYFFSLQKDCLRT